MLCLLTTPAPLLLPCLRQSAVYMYDHTGHTSFGPSTHRSLQREISGTGFLWSRHCSPCTLPTHGLSIHALSESTLYWADPSILGRRTAHAFRPELANVICYSPFIPAGVIQRFRMTEVRIKPPSFFIGAFSSSGRCQQDTHASGSGNPRYLQVVA